MIEPPPPTRELGEELARVRGPLSDHELLAFSRWVARTYGGDSEDDVMVLGTGDWLTVYRQPR